MRNPFAYLRMRLYERIESLIHLLAYGEQDVDSD